jgi:hypothetical protein
MRLPYNYCAGRPLRLPTLNGWQAMRLPYNYLCRATAPVGSKYRNPKLEIRNKVRITDRGRIETRAVSDFPRRTLGNCFELRASNFGFSDRSAISAISASSASSASSAVKKSNPNDHPAMPSPNFWGVKKLDMTHSSSQSCSLLRATLRDSNI